MTNFRGMILCSQLSFERLQFHWSSSSGNSMQTYQKIVQIPREDIPYCKLSALREISGSSGIKFFFQILALCDSYINLKAKQLQNFLIMSMS